MSIKELKSLKIENCVKKQLEIDEYLIDLKNEYCLRNKIHQYQL